MRLNGKWTGEMENRFLNMSTQPHSQEKKKTKNRKFGKHIIYSNKK